MMMKPSWSSRSRNTESMTNNATYSSGKKLKRSLAAVFFVSALVGMVGNENQNLPNIIGLSSILDVGEQRSNITYSSRRALEVEGQQSHRRLARFRLQTGDQPEVHPSQPYFVRLDEETGALLDTIPYASEEHPLLRLVDLQEPRDAEHETVFFFEVPKVQGDNVRRIMTQCYNLRRAQKTKDPESLDYINGLLNIDLQSRKGLAKAQSKHLINMDLVDVIATSYFLESVLLFKTAHRGRAFTILEHPVARAEKQYHERDPSLEGISMLSYVNSPEYIDNWVVRSLTNDKAGPITEEHLTLAKGMLTRKFFVGIAEYMEETIRRLEVYYGWNKPEDCECVNNNLDNQPDRSVDIERGSHEWYLQNNQPDRSNEWELITTKDKYDLMLYQYGLKLFNGSIPSQPVVELLRQRKLAAFFSLNSGELPVAHPGSPYLVRLDQETGAFVQTIEYGHEEHPLSRLVDVREMRESDAQETIFYLMMPQANGDKMKAIMTNCYKLRRAQKKQEPESLEYVDGTLNFDAESRDGLGNARSKDIIGMGLVDVIATGHFLEGMFLFKPDHRGRAFTILEHPVVRGEKEYRSRDPSLRGLVLLGFLESPHFVDNFMIRSLTNDKKGRITEDHLNVAKGILARKFMVGIAEYMEETIKRLEMYYGLNEPSGNEECVNDYLGSERVHEMEVRTIIERGSHEWKLITSNDRYDMMLYYYGLELFTKQGSTLFKRPYVDKTGEPVDFLKRKEEQDKKDLLAMLGLSGA